MSQDRGTATTTVLADEQAEQAILGVLLQRSDALRDTAQSLAADDFYYERHRHIFAAIHALDEARETVDSVTVSTYLARHAVLEAAGGPQYLARLRNENTVTTNIGSYIGIIKDYSLRRRVVSTAREAIRLAGDSTDGAVQIADTAVHEFMSLAVNESGSTVQHIEEPMSSLLRRIQEQLSQDRQGMLTGVPSGFTLLDRMTNGWQPGDLIILAARPGMGKTAFALNLLVNAAMDTRSSTAGVIFTLEMGAEQLVGRVLSSMARVPGDKFRSGDLNDKHLDSMYRTVESIKGLPIYIDETPSISVSELARKCRQLKYKHNLGFVLIDYLQLMSGSTSARISNREQEISDISRRLKALARELECPVIALSQLNRAVEQRADKRPMLSDLRESGAIEQDADIILFLYRQIYYDRLANKPAGEDDGYGGGGGGDRLEMMPSRDGDDAEVIIAKHRSGATGMVTLTFHESFTLFTNRIGDEPPPLDDRDLQGRPTAGFDPDVDFGPPSTPSVPEAPVSPSMSDFDGYDFGEDDDLPI